jgi:uncharacterized protein
MITDIHFHLAGVCNGEHIYLSYEMRAQAVFVGLSALLLLKKGAATNEAALEWATDVIAGSSKVDKIVALAMDWVYDDNHKPDPTRIHLWVSNDWVAEQAKKMGDRMYFGASVNPNRADACEELDRVSNMGAILIKLIPSSQDIDLMDEKHGPYFEKMKELNLPLLCHTGVEHTIPSAGIHVEHTKPGAEANDKKQALNSPSKLRGPLSYGVKVIAAHCALPMNKEEGEAAYEELRGLFNDYKENLYADVSAFFVPFSPFRKHLAERVTNELPQDRLILGSDFPMLPSALLGGYWSDMAIHEIVKYLLTDNPLDRNVMALQALGFQDCVFTNAEKVLRTAA